MFGGSGWRRGLLGVVASLLVAPGAAQAAITLHFDDRPAGTALANQDENLGGHHHGVVFGDTPTAASRQPVITAGVSRSAPNSVNTCVCHGEFPGPSELWGRFDLLKSRVTVYVGTPAVTAVVLTGYDAAGNALPNAAGANTVAGDHVTTQIVLSEPSPQIAYFKLAAPTGQQMYVDDLSFDDPPASGSPDFAIALNSIGGPSGTVALNTAFSETVGLTATRVNNSSGPIDYTVSGLPARVSASFGPSAHTGARSVGLELTAQSNVAPVTGAQIRITAHPSSPAVGATNRQVTFTLNVLAAYDARVTGIEVNQSAQGLFSFCSNTAACAGVPSLEPGDANHSATYVPPEIDNAGASIQLVSHHPTEAIVYANIARPAGASISGAGMKLFGSVNGHRLPGSPLVISTGPVLGNGSGKAFVTYADRAAPHGAFDFRLPDSWLSSGTMTLRAELIPPVIFLASGAAECSDPGCGANNTFTLTGLTFKPSGAVYWDPVEMKTHSEPFPPGTWQVFQLPQQIMPIAPSNFHYTSYYDGLLDETAIHHTYADGSDQADSAAADLLSSWIDDHDSCAQRACTDVTVGVNAAVGRGLDRGSLLNGDQPYDVVDYNRPLTSVPHEMSHALGRPHADTTCGGGSNGQIGQEWDPDQAGKLDSIGLDLSNFQADPVKASNSIAPGFGRPADYFDFMSYCASETDAWVSARGWNESYFDLVNSQHGQFSSADRATSARSASGRYLRVAASVTPKGVSIDHVRIGSRRSPPGGRSSSYELVAHAGDGRELARSAMRQAVENIHTIGQFSTLTAALPLTQALAGVASVSIESAGQVLAAKRRSAHPPTVTLLGLRPGARIGDGQVTSLRWRAKDVDGGGPLTIGVQVSLDGGRSYRPVWEGIGGTGATIPSVMLGESRHARLRVRASDGFNDGAAISPPLVALGRPPVVAITSPQAGVHVASDGVLALAGIATDDLRVAVPGARLTWRIGPQTVGHGTALDRTGLPVGRQLVTLTARDSRGRIGRASVLVIVDPAPPRILALDLVTPLSTTASAVSLRIATTERAGLIVAGSRFVVGPTPRVINIPIQPGAGPLNLDLLLGAEGLVTQVPLNVPRS